MFAACGGFQYIRFRKVWPTNDFCIYIQASIESTHDVISPVCIAVLLLARFISIIIVFEWTYEVPCSMFHTCQLYVWWLLWLIKIALFWKSGWLNMEHLSTFMNQDESLFFFRLSLGFKWIILYTIYGIIKLLRLFDTQKACSIPGWIKY